MARSRKAFYLLAAAGLVAIALAISDRPAHRTHTDKWASRGIRVVHFPRGRSLGALFVSDWDDMKVWLPLAAARGDVRVPKNKALSLAVGRSSIADEPSIWSHALEAVGIDSRSAAPADLAALAKIGPADLQSIDASGAPIVDSDLRHLLGLKTLFILDLSHTPLGDEGLEHVGRVTCLRELRLAGTQITGDGLKHLRNLAALESLNLSGTAVTDAGLRHLEALPSLKEIFLANTAVTTAGHSMLKRNHPDCRIAD